MTTRLSVTTALALCLMSGSLLPPAARADLALTGGTPAQQGQIQSVFSSMPPRCHTTCRVCVSLLGDQAMDACLRMCAAAHAQRLVNADAVDGFYQDPLTTITLRTSSPTTDVSATFAHEYGHYVWMNVLSPAQREQYRNVYNAPAQGGASGVCLCRRVGEGGVRRGILVLREAAPPPRPEG